MNQIIVQKYGGTSVSTTDRILAIAEHIKWTRENTGNGIVVAISAMGDQTDRLLDLAAEISGTPPKRELDMLLSTGERISMALLAIALNKYGVNTISLTGSQSGILTDEYHGNARISKVSGERIRQGLADNNVVIVAGFQGVSPKTKDITTLGRGGTDLTAVALAASLGAESCELYKDVTGILECDPEFVSQPRLISQLPWDIMTELAWSGASVVNPRAAHLAQKFKVKVQINSFMNPQNRGTEIFGDIKMEGAALFGIATKNDQVLVEIDTGETKKLSKIVEWMWSNDDVPLINHCLKRKIVISMKSSLLDSLPISNSIQEGSYSAAECNIVTVAGIGLMQAPEIISKFLEIASDFDCLEVAYSNQVLRAACKPELTSDFVSKLHATFF